MIIYMLGQEKPTFKKINRKGQIAVEYILLVLIAVTIAATLVSVMVSRNEEEPGFLIRAWQNIITTISTDQSGEPL